jgi:two-component system CheB/CheR fusion protein
VYDKFPATRIEPSGLSDSGDDDDMQQHGNGGGGGSFFPNNGGNGDDAKDLIDFADMGRSHTVNDADLVGDMAPVTGVSMSNFSSSSALYYDADTTAAYDDAAPGDQIGLYSDDPVLDDGDHPEDDEKRSFPEELHVVGIGASAGGLDAIKCFFSSFNANQEELSRLAFVVIQHISISYKSMMLEILSSQLHDIKLYEVHHGLRLEPRSIYFIPSKFSMTIQDRIFHLHPRKDDSPGFLPIDKFFTSLADSFGSNAIGVVLSGTGKDGTEGIKAIHRAKGVVLVQNVESAEFDGMPKSAIETNVVDGVMYPEDMLCFIFDLVGNRMTQSGEESDVSIYQLLRLVESDVDIDFSYYKYPTLQRRISRRMKENGCNSLKEYRDILVVNKMERMKLVDSVLIDVTSFFRGDFAFFEHHLIPQIVEMVRPSDVIRIWVSACSTGEEAYTLAMLFLEYREISNKPFSVKVFATDVKSGCLRIAQKGEYPYSIEKHVSAKRLLRFFTKMKTCYRVKSELRNTIVFVKHNIITNNPFINLHLISCRNCLIYMKVEAQKIALQSFHFGLMEGGFLTLGSSESVHKSITGFAVFNRKANVFRKTHRQKMNDFSALPFARTKPAKPSDMLSLLSKEMILYHYPNPFLIVDGDWTLLYANELAKRFISLSLGTIITNVCDMVVPSLKIPLKSAVLRAKTRGENVSVTSITIEEELCDLDTVVLNLDDMLVYAVVIKPRDMDKANKSAMPADQSSILFLQEELQKTKQELQHTMEQLETSNEELQSSNEELQSSNEELQSTNEELRCINREFQDKIRLLNEINNDMNHLIWSINIGIMFLGSDLKIRKFTPAIAPIVAVRESDIGRSITDLVFRGGNDVISLIEKVLASGIKRETTIVINDRMWSVRILPYVTNSEVTGVIITSYERFVVDDSEQNGNADSVDKKLEEDERLKNLLKPMWNPQSLTYVETQNLENASFWSGDEWVSKKMVKIKETTARLESILYSRDDVDLETLAISLESLLIISSSEFGYIAEHRIDKDTKKPYVLMRVASDIGWDFSSRNNFTSSLRSGIEFKPKKNLLSAVVDAQTVIIANELGGDTRTGGLPPGHPPIKSYLALPLYLDDIVIGSIGLANRPHGYNDSVVKVLEPIAKLIGKCLIRFFMFSEEQLRKTVSKAQEMRQKSAAEIRYRSMLEAKNPQ